MVGLAEHSVDLLIRAGAHVPEVPLRIRLLPALTVASSRLGGPRHAILLPMAPTRTFPNIQHPHILRDVVHQHHLLSISTSALHQMDAFQLSNHPMLLVDVGMLPFCAWPAGRAPLTRDLLPLPRFTRPR